MPQRVPVFILAAISAGLFLTACTDDGQRAPQAKASRLCDEAGVRSIVTRFGKSLQRVSVLAPQPVLERSIRDVYAPFVTPRLLQTWLKNPAAAPGKRVSSPWPARIDIDSVRQAGNDTCVVTGKVIYLTSVELAHGGMAATEQVVLRVRKYDRWQISVVVFQDDIAEFRTPVQAQGARPRAVSLNSAISS